MASLYKKVISGKPYWYLREMGWVDGKPKMVSERYVGTAADIEALLDALEERMLPEQTRHLDFGAVAAKQKRADLRLVGLGLVVTRDRCVPLLSHAYPGSKPDVTQFPQMIRVLAARHADLAAAAGQDGTD